VIESEENVMVTPDGPPYDDRKTVDEKLPITETANVDDP